jgi:methylglyoxal reductase
MRTRKLGNSGIEASVVGLGAWVLGGGTVWGKDTDDAESIATIRAALDAGITLIDTAPAYGFGRSEEVVGKAIHGRRDKVVLATKCGLWWDDQRGSYFCEFDGRPMRRSLRPDTVTTEVENSLRRLGTDYIDLYQTHWPAIDPDKTPIADTMACLMKLKEQGKIRAIGVSNVSPEELVENVAAGEVASNQFRYSMLYRAPEKDILPACQRNHLATLTYMSLEQGLLTGKVGMDRTFTPGDFRSNGDWNPWYKVENRGRVLAMLARFKPLNEKYACTTAQLTIAWTLAQSGVTHTLAGARRAIQAQENARGGDLLIDSKDLAAIRKEVEGLDESAQ